jgi:uncharacterized membrane protein
MAHLYRGEMQRLTVWRTRLDTTSHWAILLSAGLITFALGAADVPHFIMLLALALNTIFMIIEGRRYQHLHHSRWRLRLLEESHFSELLEPRDAASTAWRHALADDLRQPRVTLGMGMAIRMRLRRNYLMLLYFITAVWLTKVFIHPGSPHSAAELYRRLAVGDLLPSWFVAASAGLFIATVTLLAAITPSEEALMCWVPPSRGAGPGDAPPDTRDRPGQQP